MLQDLVNKTIIVKLKWSIDTYYKGRLQAIDSYMNLALMETEEFVNDKSTGVLGQILIRCNNVLYIRGADQGGDGGGDVSMGE